ncbi:MAG: two-component regulator propeller domain-containing protein [Chitinophagaceae bacterium]
MKKSVVIAGLIFSIAAIGQSPPLSFRNITINDGLSQNSVVDITTDDAGFLWLATQDGLNRYDGREFIVYKKNFDDVTTTTGSTLGKIATGTNNQLWLITSGGRLEKFNILNPAFTPVTLIPFTNQSLPAVSSVDEEKSGDLWIGTQHNGVWVCRNKNKQAIHYTADSKENALLISNNIQQVFCDHRQQHWILTDKGITLITSNRTQHFSMPSCSNIDEDKEGNIWVGTYGNGLYLKRKTDSNFISFTGFNRKPLLSAAQVIQTIKADNEGNIWIGTYGNDLFLINTADSIVTHIVADKKNPLALAYTDILCIKEDNHGGMWIGTDGGGVSHYDKRMNHFLLLTKNNTPEKISIEQVRAINTDHNGGVWIGTSNNGLTYTNLKGDTQTLRFAPFSKEVVNPDRIVSLFTDNDGDIWTGTQGNGLFIIDGKTRKVKQHFYPGAAGLSAIPDYTIWTIQPANNNRVWLGTRNAGLCLFDKQNGLIKNFAVSSAANSILDNNIRTLTAIGNVLFIGFEKEGFQFFDTVTGNFYTKFDDVVQKIKNEEISLKCALYQYPYIWLGTLGKGLIALRLESDKSWFISEKMGLPNNTIYGILPEKSGVLWMSSNKGLFRFIFPASLETTNRSNFSHFTVADGLQSNEFNTGAYHLSADGKLFFGGINGLNIFKPDNLISSDKSANIVITEATINNKPFVSDTSITYKKILKLPYDQRSLSFNFTVLDFIPSGGFNYYYQLQGYDKDWIDAGNRNYAAYTNLRPGNYTFRVKASHQFSGTNDQITTLHITIQPPYWQTWWFVLLCILALAGILYSIYRYRVNQLIKLQKIRNRIGSDLHDDIGSSLTNIGILSELSKANLSQSTETETFLNRITEEAQHAAQDLDDIVWSINTSNDRLDQIVARMRRYAAEMFDGAGIQYTLNFDEQFAQRKLNMELRRDVFLVFKESINNIYKHAGAKKVDITVSLSNRQLDMSINDDGKGFDTTLLTHRNGIRNMQQRIEKWKGVIRIESTQGKGTQLRVYLPVH